ncbi:Oidioi.mRNA.OKI2018_I69.chr1.g1637.t1.cds [Oikopleura dioica]|uniref:Oidioi.mRNA.OKI2018_I69.chr1.g1637.t1.cds n=1 Tax=Oikopleura dioica TaxID=34765 RepID=A0ABN7SQ73_OIKDI|nr:Oidioi.mRNA.OKI2018_I69.chr1.g1637.t1.cds [Oikopleura dioica]
MKFSNFILATNVAANGFEPTWSVKPGRKQPKLNAKCFKFPKIIKKNIEKGTSLSCVPRTPHPCEDKAGFMEILDGSLVLTEKINSKRAKFNLVCDDGTVQGEVVCVNRKNQVYFQKPQWSNQITWQDSWKDICREFAPLTNSTTADLQTCSEADNFPELASVEERIIGGVPVEENEWPWITHLTFDLNDGGEKLCGGSVIANRWVISAAHCCLDVQKIVGRFGDLNATEFDSNEYELEASAWFNDPEYDRHADDKNNDLCLIKFNEDIIASDPESKVQPVCLPKEVHEHGAACWVAGWGSFEYMGGPQNPDLHSVGVNVFSAEYCLANSLISLAADDICAYKPDLNGDGLLDSGASFCDGDSGGPLICPTDGKATLVGVVSTGIECTWEGYPNKYTSTFVTSNWIQETVAAEGL